MAPKGYVMQLQPFSVNDGDGIRTAVFLAGCPLQCAWCANPEGCTHQFISKTKKNTLRRMRGLLKDRNVV